jgi:hypothetical protein
MGTFMSKCDSSALNYGKSAMKMGHSPLKEEKKPKTIEQEAAKSRARGKQSFMKAQAEKSKKSGAHTGKMVTVTTSTGPKKFDSRSPEYKHIMKAKEENKQVETKVIMDKYGTHYTGWSKT